MRAPSHRAAHLEAVRRLNDSPPATCRDERLDGKAHCPKNDTTANFGFEAKLWAAADALRNKMDAAEYRHVVPGLIFLKYISDPFEAKRAEVEAQVAQDAHPEHPDEYPAASNFWVPKKARRQHPKANTPHIYFMKESDL